MPARSAGILLWRREGDGGIAVLLGHMGGPLWARKDVAAWSFPKGEYGDDEHAVDAACREFAEELGLAVPVGADALVPLGEVRQPNGKRLTLWAAEGDLDAGAVVPGTFVMQWPPRSGVMAEFPEIDRVEWCGVDRARERLVVGQRPFLDRLRELLSEGTAG